MKKKVKKAMSMLLVAALTAGISISGTMAYLTSEDSDLNVMTLGNVKIKQHEYERVEKADGTYDTVDNGYKLQDFTQAKPLLPIVGDPSASGDAYKGWDDTSVPMDQVDSYGTMQVFAGKNAVDKFVTVENTGMTDTYVRTLIAFEMGSTTEEEFGELISSSDRSTKNNEDLGSPWYQVPVGVITVDGNSYYLYEYIYHGAKLGDGSIRHEKGILPAGDTTYPSLAQVYLSHTATNEDCEALDGNNNGTYDILVLSQAVQADGFDDAVTALDAAFGDITVTNHPFEGATVTEEIGITEGGTYNLEGDIYTIDTAYFHTQNATSPVTINGNGAVVNSVATSIDAFAWDENGTIPYMSAIFASENGEKVTVNDLTFTGTISSVCAGRYVGTNSDWFNTEFNNVDIVDTEVVSFSAGISPALSVYGTLTMNDCNVYGTMLSKLDTDPQWPVYDMAVVNNATVNINNSKVGTIYMWNKAQINISNSTVDNIILRGNMNTGLTGITVKAGATVNVIDLTNVTNSSKVVINIEEGGSVGSYVDGGISYNTLDAWKAAP